MLDLLEIGHGVVEVFDRERDGNGQDDAGGQGEEHQAQAVGRNRVVAHLEQAGVFEVNAPFFPGETPLR